MDQSPLRLTYKTEYNCELCKQKREARLFSRGASHFTKDKEPELIKWARHYHWVDYHRLCAVCGKLVKTGELEVAENNGEILIHKNYTYHYKKIKTGERYGPLLIVHSNCIVKA